jgi:hypothetical protein
MPVRTRFHCRAPDLAVSAQAEPRKLRCGVWPSFAAGMRRGLWNGGNTVAATKGEHLRMPPLPGLGILAAD